MSNVINDMRKLIILLFALLLMASCTAGPYSVAPVVNAEVIDSYDSELGFDINRKVFVSIFRKYLENNYIGYEIIDEEDREIYSDFKVHYCYLSNNSSIVIYLNEKKNIAAFGTAAWNGYPESLGLDVMMDIFKSIAIPYPETWKSVKREIEDLEFNEEYYYYGAYAFHKYNDQGIKYYLLSPTTFTFD
jgi:hypothetical protein